MAVPTAPEQETQDRLHFLMLNIGHFLDHLFTLIFATVAAVALTREWGLGYAELLPYAAPGFFAFGAFALPAGWLADKWSREGMIAVYFIGIGMASVAASYVATPFQMGVALFVIGAFAAIYHPVGLAIVTEKWRNTGMRLAVNGVWGNLGVGSAALITGYCIDHGGWRSAFVYPGVLSIIVGLAYAWAMRTEILAGASLRAKVAAAQSSAPMTADYRAALFRISLIVFLTTALGSIIFQSTTFALPKVFDERLGGIAPTASVLGQMAFMVFAVASIGQVVVGHYLDRVGPRRVFMVAAALQVVFFGLMPGLRDWSALICALAFMLAAFGQIPINDYMIGRMAQGSMRARVYGLRYVVSFTVLALALPMISIIYQKWGFDTLFRVLAMAAFIILLAVMRLPERLPTPAPVAVTA
ncbi:MAG: MFS transporter [Hyphomicrobiaceae bacterium]